MRKKIQLASSGISFVDDTWGGFYNCSTYLLVGPRKSGKTLLALQFTKEAVKQQTLCIYFTNMRPKDLMINAASINFDLQYYMELNQVILIRTNPPSEKDLGSEPDKHLAGYLQEIISVVEQYQPGKIIFDELTPFVGYNDINKLKDACLQTCEAIEDLGITSLFVLSEPVSQQSRNVVELLKENSTGLIHLRKKENSESSFYGGDITIIPNIGHTEGRFKADYRIQPQKGIVTDFLAPSQPAEYLSPPKKRKESEYKSLSEIDVPPESYPVINFYNENEFRLLLDNQIAYYKSTGKLFALCSVLLNEETDGQGLLTINQLKNAVRLSVDKKDKICVLEDRVIVLVLNEDQKSVNNLIARIKSNLPSENIEHLNRIIKYISVFTIQVDKNTNRAEDFLSKIFSDKAQDKAQ